MKYEKVFLFVIAMVPVVSSCSDDDENGNGNKNSIIPEMEVSLSLSLSYQDIDLVPLLATKSFSSSDRKKVGYGGVLVINGIGENQINLYAYDLACPVECDENIRVLADEYGKAKCERCGAVYNIMNGIGTSETNTKYSLKTYKVNYSQGRYVVTNPNYKNQ